MAHVILMPSLARRFAGGRAEHEIDGRTIRQLIRGLDARFPGIADRLELGVAVAIDGEIHQNALFEEVRPDSEVCFIPAIEGG